jgi:hypothetical protein
VTDEEIDRMEVAAPPAAGMGRTGLTGWFLAKVLDELATIFAMGVAVGAILVLLVLGAAWMIAEYPGGPGMVAADGLTCLAAMGYARHRAMRLERLVATREDT